MYYKNGRVAYLDSTEKFDKILNFFAKTVAKSKKIRYNAYILRVFARE